jgi:hypothetical protein
MDIGLLLLAVGIAWFGLAYALRERRDDSRISSSGPDRELGSIFPARWIPPFLRNQWVAEEVLRSRVLYRCRCPKELKAKFRYRDQRFHRDVLFERGILGRGAAQCGADQISLLKRNVL